MKYLMAILLCFIFFATPAMNRRKIPAMAEEYIEHLYPKAQKIEWHKIKVEHLIEAEFKNYGKNVIVLFKADGRWKQVQEEISPDNLPEIIKDKMQNKYKAESVLQVTNNGEDSFYLITGKKNKKFSFEIYSTQDGQDFQPKLYRTQPYKGVFTSIVLLMILLFP